MKPIALILSFTFVLAALGEEYTSSLVSGDKLRSRLGLTSEYLAAAPLQNIRLAVFASAPRTFTPGQQDNARYLPEGSSLWSGKREIEKNALTDWDGRRLAQAVNGILSTAEQPPQIRIFVVASPSEFRESLEAASDWGANVVLSTVLFPYFGNFDGTGPIDNLVEDFVDGGGAWVQSVGAYHHRVSERPFPAVDKPTFGSFVINADETPLLLTLTWKGFSPSGIRQGTDLDLNLKLYSMDPERVLIGESNWKQVTHDADSAKHETNIAAEQISVMLDASTKPYQFSVANGTKTGDTTGESYRLVFSSPKGWYSDQVKGTLVDPIQIDKPSPDSILIPADSRHAISVGSTLPADSRGVTDDKRTKPEVTVPNAEVIFSDRMGLAGSDAGAAEVAAVVAVLKAVSPGVRLHVIQKMLQERSPLISADREKGTLLPSLAEWRKIENSKK